MDFIKCDEPEYYSKVVRGWNLPFGTWEKDFDKEIIGKKKISSK